MTGHPEAIPNVQYVQDAIAAAVATVGSVQTITAVVPLNVNSGPVTIGTLPTNSGMVILSVKVLVTTVDTGATLQIGVGATANALVDTTDTDEQTAGMYLVENFFAVSPGAIITATVASSSNTGSGSCKVIVEYMA